MRVTSPIFHPQAIVLFTVDKIFARIQHFGAEVFLCNRLHFSGTLRVIEGRIVISWVQEIDTQFPSNESSSN